MFGYRKRHFYPVYVEKPDPEFGGILLEHYSGKNCELSTAVQYLNHRSNMPNRYLSELLGLIAAEELSHMETIAVAIKKLGLVPGYINLMDISGHPQESFDPLVMLRVDIESENRELAFYKSHLNVTNDPGLQKMLKFLWRREDVHRHLLVKAQKLIQVDKNPEQFNELIYDYRMSLQVLE